MKFYWLKFENKNLHWMNLFCCGLVGFLFALVAPFVHSQPKYSVYGSLLPKTPIDCQYSLELEIY